MKSRVLLLPLLLVACDESPAERTETPVHPATPTEEQPAIAHEAANPPPEIAQPYEEGVDAEAQINAALAREGKRVILVFGANWCPWCRRLEHTFQNDAPISAKLAEAFELVHVDVGPRESDTNRELARRYGDPLTQGLPCLVVLNEEGNVAHVQETGSLEEGDRHDPAKVLAFLDRWAIAG